MKHAFPSNGEYYKTPGMTLREYYAGQALVGLLAGRTQGTMFTCEQAAANARVIADALCAALKEADKGDNQ